MSSNRLSALKIGILATEGSWYYRDLERAARDRRYDCDLLEFSRLVAEVTATAASFWSVAPVNPDANSPANRETALHSWSSASDYDCILVRTMPPGSLEQVVYRMDLLARLECNGTRVVNSPKSLECAIDKYLTTARLQAAGLPVPETVVCEHEDDAMVAFERLGGDVVVKPLFGSEGRGIVRVTDPDLAHRTFRTLMRLNAVIYLQRFVNHGGFDVRILVLNGRVLGGMKRHSPHDFRTNVARQGIAEPHTPTAREIDLALRAVATTGTFVAGVDLLYDQNETCHVIEVNAVPGWQAFARVTGIDVAGELMDELAAVVNGNRNQETTEK